MLNIIRKKIIILFHLFLVFIILAGGSLSSIQNSNEDIFLNELELKSFILNEITENDNQIKILYPLLSVP